jgi:hypothetical protein
MNALIIFDVSRELEVVKNTLIVQGYWPRWSNNPSGEIFHLPKNVVWKPNCELRQAKQDIITIISNLNIARQANPIQLLRCIVLSVNPWDGIAGVE